MYLSSSLTRKGPLATKRVIYGDGTKSKLPLLRHPLKRRMALERPHLGRQQAEADRAAAVAVVDAVDYGRQFLAPLIGRIE
jgi:hypothetical protein